MQVVKDLRTLLQKDMNTGAWRATGKFINVLTTANVYKVGSSWCWLQHSTSTPCAGLR